MDTAIADLETGRIICPSGMPAYYAKPAGSEKRACAILIHERYGLVEHTIDLTNRLAADGYVTLAPDLYFRHPDQAALHRGDEMMHPVDPEIRADIRVAVEALGKLPGADLERLGVIGACQTGRLALVYGAEHPLAAAVVLYGAATSPREWEASRRFPVALPDLMARIDCPVLGIFGEGDHVISIDDVRRFRNTLEGHRKSHEVHMIRGAPHGWLNHTMPGRYRREASEQTWAIMVRFLGEAVGGKWPKDRFISRYESDIGLDYDYAKNKRQAY